MPRPDQPIIKICGLRDLVAATAAVSAGATAIGFILAESKRRVLPETIADIRSALPSLRPPVVGVVVNEQPARLAEIAETAGLDIIQLSGDEDPSILDSLHVPAWKTLRFGQGTTVEQASRAIEPWLDHQHAVELIHVDAAVAGMYGGSGHRTDWQLAAELASRYPVVLAGGLDPENVGEAIQTVAPLGVDVSSGVEISGKKDPARIRAFIANGRAAFEDQTSSSNSSR